MEVSAPAQSFDIRDASAVSQVRRAVAAAASALGFSAEDTARGALVATEMSTNLLKHADGGELILTHALSGGRHGLDLLALDTGPGIAEIERCLRDGYSTAGSPGTGLGAIQRQSQSFDLYSQVDKGTVVHARLFASVSRVQPPAAFDICGFTVAVRGESVSGDCWTMRERTDGVLILGADGLGHGPGAAEASQMAARILWEQSGEDPGPLMEMVHRGLRPSRGAAVAIADIDLSLGRVAFAGIGNVAGSLFVGGAVRRLMSHNGTVGHVARHFRALDYPFADEGVFVLHSDGLASSWQLDRYPGLLLRNSGVIAGVLYRDFKRGRDDTLVVVAKWGTR